MSAPTVLRARLSDDGRVELIDPLPPHFHGQHEGERTATKGNWRGLFMLGALLL